MENERKLRILRTAVGSMPADGLNQELLDYGFEVVGVDCDPYSFGLYNLEESYLIPKANDHSFLDSFLSLISDKKIDAILVGPEEELLILSKNKDKIEAKGALLLSPSFSSVNICVDKLAWHNFLNSKMIPTPDIFEDKSSAEFPCIIKPRFGRGSDGVHLVNNLDELKMRLNEVPSPIIQEYVEGIEVTVDVLSDKNGNSVSIVPRIRKKINSGLTVVGQTFKNDLVIKYTSQIVKELKLFGPSCIQCILSGSRIKFIDANCRFGGGSILSIKADSGILKNLFHIIKNKELVASSEFKENLVMLRNYKEVFLDEASILK